jgi:hypothetical protein
VLDTSILTQLTLLARENFASEEYRSEDGSLEKNFLCSLNRTLEVVRKRRIPNDWEDIATVKIQTIHQMPQVLSNYPGD